MSSFRERKACKAKPSLSICRECDDSHHSIAMSPTEFGFEVQSPPTYLVATKFYFSTREIVWSEFDFGNRYMLHIWIWGIFVKTNPSWRLVEFTSVNIQMRNATSFFLPKLRMGILTAKGVRVEKLVL